MKIDNKQKMKDLEELNEELSLALGYLSQSPFCEYVRITCDKKHRLGPLKRGLPKGYVDFLSCCYIECKAHDQIAICAHDFAWKVLEKRKEIVKKYYKQDSLDEPVSKIINEKLSPKEIRKNIGVRKSILALLSKTKKIRKKIK